MLEPLPLADAISTAIRFVTALYYVYLLLIFVYILTSWIRLPYSPWLSRFQRFLYDTVNPYLSLFRRLLPGLRLGGVGLDLSPILGILALSAAWRLIVAGIEQLR
ncbi:MAG: YggT family protein [Thermoleophilia bacterium]|nr:YggT family protein [Thermoleophilia bacterium]